MPIVVVPGTAAPGDEAVVARTNTSQRTLTRFTGNALFDLGGVLEDERGAAVDLGRGREVAAMRAARIMRLVAQG